MEVEATGKYIRISSSKVQKVARLIRGKSADEAINILVFTPRKGCRIMEAILRSAIANAKDRYGLAKETLFVKFAQVNQGPTLKGTKPRARGRADLIRKRTSHITIVLDTNP